MWYKIIQKSFNYFSTQVCCEIYNYVHFINTVNYRIVKHMENKTFTSDEDYVAKNILQ